MGKKRIVTEGAGENGVKTSSVSAVSKKKIDVGGIYYTSTEKACCPVKVIVTSFNHLVVNFKTKDGLEHSKNFNDFMKSSWVDRSV